MSTSYIHSSDNPYEILLNDRSEVAENAFSYHYLTERHLQVIWLEQKYFKNLLTSEGIPIQVLSPGLWNTEAGPDFCKAHLKIGSIELHGDVEIHLADEGWAQHHHHLDPRYNDVILHLSLWEPAHQKTLLTSTRKTILQAYLEHRLTISHTRILHLIDLDLYPYKQFVGSGKCAHKLFRNLPENKAVLFFQNAADWRLMRKISFLKTKVESPDLYMGTGIAMALGYKHNAEAFFQLFQFLLNYPHLNESELLVLGLGVCGFFEPYFTEKWSFSPFYQELRNSFVSLNFKISPFISFVLHHIRPLNHPIRRIAYLAKLVSPKELLHTLLSQLFKIWNDNWQIPSKEKKWLFLRQQLLSLVPSYNDPYWNCYYLFENSIKKEFLTLMGENLKREILINTFLPLLYEHITAKKNPQEIQAFKSFYTSLPAGKAGKSAYLVHRFFGDTPKGNLLNKAYTEQGAYQLHRDFCLHYEASCEGCPFVEKYATVFKGCEV